jgi:hypothetical protein
MPHSSRTLRSRHSALHSQPPAGRLADSALPDNSPVKAQLERICGSRLFSGANRSQLFLRYVVEHSAAHPTEPLKEYSVALDVFERDTSYDPAIDATVRVEAGRLRSRLLEYYAREGEADPLLIEIPRGGYRAVIRPHRPATVPLSRPFKLMPAAAPRLSHLLAIPAAFILGALLGHRFSR